jgi:CRP-like cAMP-binding protein
MEDGGAIEVATIGNEGLVGYAVATGGKRSPNKVIVQIADGALRVEAQALRGEAARGGTLKDLLDGYHEAYMAQVSQSVACNGLHTLEKRCCRWLLMTRDRVGSDELQLTHEYLGIMLGVRRASVTDVLKLLQEEKLVISHRGTVSILDGAKVEARSCECYRVVKGEYDRLLGGGAPG